MSGKTRPKQPSASPPRPSRVIIENVQPQVDAGRYPIKRVVGEEVEVTADIHADGHDALAAVLRWRRAGDDPWSEVALEESGNDRWRGRFVVSALEPYEYTLAAWVDHFRTWQRDLRKKRDAGQDVAVDLQEGAALVEETARRVRGVEARELAAGAKRLGAEADASLEERTAAAFDPELSRLMQAHPDRRLATAYEKVLRVVVEREKARFSAWYEMFPRSTAPEPGRHGTFKDCEALLPYVASLGFDVLYFPPIHPIGRTNRKGKNNSPQCGPGDVGSPWAIGAEEGGHKAIHPQLGTLADFQSLRARAAEQGLEIALDLAFQCTPDHPYVQQHPQWFRQRPDGSIQFAENPPKKYEDIYPINFETEDWEALWEELKSVVLYWVEQGVRLFRVDNPHTKPYAFWEWLIAEVRRDHPDVVFLSEAFTRPRVMYELAKLGFSQSYTYFTWRNTKAEFVQYFTELTQTEVREYFRPNLWPNTPDILPEHLQVGGRAAFQARLILAATLGANYGVYGPAFELCENRPLAPGREEYLNAEKYELKHWDREEPESLRSLITRVNRLRRENPALHRNDTLEFLPIGNDQLLAYSKRTPDLDNIVLVVVNLDFYNPQAGWLELPLARLGIDPQQSYQVHDLISEARYFWHGARNYVEINPHVLPAHVFRIRRRLCTERDFDYYL